LFSVNFREIAVSFFFTTEIKSQREGCNMVRRQAGILAFYKAANTGGDRRIRELREDVRQQIGNDAYFQSSMTFSRAMRNLIGSLRMLFAEEECLMIRTLYPDYEMQSAAHRYFMEKLRNELVCEPDGHAVCRFVHGTVRCWLRQHDLFSDVHFFRYLEHWKQDRTSDLLTECDPEYVLLSLKIGKDAFL